MAGKVAGIDVHTKVLMVGLPDLLYQLDC